MLIRLQRVSPTHHTLEVERKNGSKESVALETKSYAIHDFAHFAYESTAGLHASFWGRLANGEGIVDLGEAGLLKQGVAPKEEIEFTEMIVGPMQGFLNGKINEIQLMEGLQNLFNAYGVEVPAELTSEVLLSTKERFQALWVSGRRFHLENQWN